MTQLYKRYVDVIVMMSMEGKMIPLYMYWDGRNGRTRYSIDKVYEVKRVASVVGGTGICYRCRIDNKERNLFFERNRWFLESHHP